MPPRVRSTGPEWDREVGQRIREMMDEREPPWTYPELSRRIETATAEEFGGPIHITAGTLRSMVEGYYGEEGMKPRRITAGEIRALSLAFDVTSDWLLGLEEDDA